MDPRRFDTLTKSLTGTGTRRGLLRLLTAIPVAGGVVALLAPEDAAGQGNGAIVGGGDNRRNARHRHDPGKDKDNRKGKRKGKHTGRGTDTGGPKTCPSACPFCQRCDTATGSCALNPAKTGHVCGDSTHGGTTLRCCNGTCPDRDCLPDLTVSDITCVPGDPGACAGLNCCKRAICVTAGPLPYLCNCEPNGSFGPCASDRDCGSGPATACICGRCQVPPS